MLLSLKKSKIKTKKKLLNKQNVRLGSKYATIPYMTYLSKMCVSTKKMVTGVAHKNILKSNK